MDKRFFEKRCHFSIRKFAIGAASVMIGASIFGLQVAQAAETEISSPNEEAIHQVQPLEKLPNDLAAAIAKAEQNGSQDSATEKEEKDTDEPVKPATEEKVTEATSPKEEKEAEVVSPKVDKYEKPAVQVDGKEAVVSEASSENPAVPEEHTDTTNQNKPAADHKPKKKQLQQTYLKLLKRKKKKTNFYRKENKILTKTGILN